MKLFLKTLLFLSLINTAQASLINRGNGLIFDDAQNLTWLQDANYAKTSGYDADGFMSWISAVTWANTLTFGGFGDWRLPTMTDLGQAGCDFSFSGTDCGFNVDNKTSELANMFEISLGNTPLISPIGKVQNSMGVTNTGPFNNLQKDIYWLGEENAANKNEAWAYLDLMGAQLPLDKNAQLHAWAVRSGDVKTIAEQTLNSVPEPAIEWLLSFGLLAFLSVNRQRFNMLANKNTYYYK